MKKQPHKPSSMHPVAQEYSSEFSRNLFADEPPSFIRSVIAFIWRVTYVLQAVLFLLFFFLLLTWNRPAMVEARHQLLLSTVERMEWRPYFTTEKHCRAPREGEVLHMELAKPNMPGNGFYCTYYIDMGGFPKVRRISEVTYSRGWKDGRAG
jgi:hypothetical protein